MTDRNNKDGLKKAPGRKDLPFLQPLAMALLSLVLVVLFFIMAMVDTRRIEKTLLHILETKGLTIIQGVQGIFEFKFNRFMAIVGEHPGASLDSNFLEDGFSSQESLAVRLTNLAAELDAKEGNGTLPSERLGSLASSEGLQAILFLDAKGDVSFGSGSLPESLTAKIRSFWLGGDLITIDLYSSSKGPQDLGFVGIKRRMGKGAIVLILDRDGIRYWGLKLTIQEAIEESGRREGVRYLAVIDEQGRVLAEVGDLPIQDGALEIDQGIGESRFPGSEASHRINTGSKDILEVSAPLRLRDKAVGLARVGLDSEEVDALLRENRRHIFLSMGLVMGIGLLAIGFLYRTQNRHLRGIQKMNERLQQLERLSSLGQLAAGVAHEIRNPLNAIGLAIQRIQREYSPLGEADSDKQFHKLIFTVREEIKRLNVIIEDFLSLSRRSRLALHPQSVSDFLERVVFLIQEEANSRRINIQTHWDEPAIVVTIDENRMRQALLNLIKNAFESISGEGTITLLVKSHSKKRVSIQIADTGIGIAPGDLDRIFSPEYTTKDKGLGLGLPIAHEIIRAHGGEVLVRSEVGRGTTFEILLPRDLESTL